MRHPFIVRIRSTAGESSELLTWQELNWRDTVPLHRFFADVLAHGAQDLAKCDDKEWSGLSRDAKAAYRSEAKDIMFSLRIGYGINKLLPYVAAPVTSLVRQFQRPRVLEQEVFGYHFGILRRPNSKAVLGISILDKTKQYAETELSFWKHPDFARVQFLEAVRNFMAWSQRTSGYKHFIAHCEMGTYVQRGNAPALGFARDLGFEQAGVRETDAKNGNGKKTHILAARNWTPRADKIPLAPNPP